MTIRITMRDKFGTETVLTLKLGSHDAIDQMVAAIKENCPNWTKIEITIE